MSQGKHDDKNEPSTQRADPLQQENSVECGQNHQGNSMTEKTAADQFNSQAFVKESVAQTIGDPHELGDSDEAMVEADKQVSDGLLLPTVVRASAGTGKTYRLTARLMRILLQGAPPESILATTFTRKAAGEILDRVLLTLAQASNESDPKALQELRTQGPSRQPRQSRARPW